MSRGIGTLNTNRKQDPSGAPFPAGSADNGVSVDTVTGRIVLGDDGNAPNPGQLLSNRYISAMGFLIEIFGAVGAVDILEALVTISGDAANPPNVRLENTDQPGSSCDFLHDGANNRLVLQFVNGVPAGSLLAMERRVKVSTISDTPAATNALFEVSDGAIATEQPSANGAGEWRLGNLVAGAVALDPNNFIEVSINGVVYRLLKAV